MKEAEQFETRLSKIPGEACLVLLEIPEGIENWNPDRPFIKFPEHDLTIKEQRLLMFNLQKNGLNDRLIITTSPYIISDFKKENVLIYDGNNIKPPRIETYGTCPTIILYEIFNYDNLIGARACNDLIKFNRRVSAETDMLQIREDARRFGESTEKILLFNCILHREKELKQGSIIEP